MNVAWLLPGNIPVYTFSLLLGGGAAIGLGWIALQTPPDQTRLAASLSLVSLGGAILGSRLLFLSLHWPYYQNHPTEIYALPWGGVSGGGALAGGALFLWIAARTMRIPLATALDQLFPLLALVYTAGWLGAWLDGSAYGAATDAWLGLPARDEWGNWITRTPLQLLAAFGGVSTLLLITFLQFRGTVARAGLAGSLGFLLITLQGTALQLFRADITPRWTNHHPDFWIGAGAAAAAILLLAWYARTGTPKSTPPPRPEIHL